MPKNRKAKKTARDLAATRGIKHTEAVHALRDVIAEYDLVDLSISEPAPVVILDRKTERSTAEPTAAELTAASKAVPFLVEQTGHIYDPLALGGDMQRWHRALICQGDLDCHCGPVQQVADEYSGA